MKKLRSSIGHDRSFIYLLFVKETFIQCYLERFLQITEALHRNRLKLILSAGMHLDPHLGTLFNRMHSDQRWNQNPRRCRTFHDVPI